MQEQLKILYQLQKVDDEINALKNEASQIPEMINELKIQIEKQSEVVERKKEGLGNLASARKDKEQELEQLEIRIANDKTKLMGVKTNKEYHALQKEITNRDEKTGVLEEEILLLMDDIEQYDVETKRLASRFKNQEKELQGKIGEYESRLAEIPVTLKAQSKNRDDLASNVQQDLMQRYNATKSQREGQAVSFVEKGICMGCYMGIPPQLFNLIQRNEVVHTCPNCHRILYFPGQATVNEV